MMSNGLDTHISHVVFPFVKYVTPMLLINLSYVNFYRSEKPVSLQRKTADSGGYRMLSSLVADSGGYRILSSLVVDRLLPHYWATTGRLLSLAGAYIGTTSGIWGLHSGLLWALSQPREAQ
jgi:hypothetical protein